MLNRADKSQTMPPKSVKGSLFARNLGKSQLGGVIFGCKNGTMNECLSKQIFGLPTPHFLYVKNIDPGLPLFLFNYDDKKLHGIFEAASSGQMYINPYGWTTDGSCRTQYPSQVQTRVRLQCHPLHEEKFKPIISDNYFTQSRFWFELDHAQTSKLMSLFASSPVVGTSIPNISAKWRPVKKSMSLSERRDDEYKTLASEVEHQLSCSSNSTGDISSLDGKNKLLKDQRNTNVVEQAQKDLIFQQLQELNINHEPKDLSSSDWAQGSTAMNVDFTENKDSNEEQLGIEEKKEEPSCASSDSKSIIAQLIQGMEELNAFKSEQTLKIYNMEQKLVEAEEQIKQLKDRCMMLESACNLSFTNNNDTMSNSFDELHLDPLKSIFLMGGYDGESWLAALDLYFPCQDVLKSLRPMHTARSYASVARFNDEIYAFGGGHCNLWYDTVESYNLAIDQWTLRPSLTKEKGSLGGATLNDKIFAVGGGNGDECFSEVEMLDLNVGRWIPTRSMLQKRFALAAVELNGALYATGGFDGNDYLS
ncbi:uncharacterized protein LOC126688246 isoform X2 [Mercurialis annua]|nr:uncharacterized protein LOC126688246 isoform X2 [Mercurialis annua]